MQNQTQVVQALLKPEAYPQKTGEIQLIQTHISYVFLIENYVYKIKKAVNFGFLDFSTLDKRLEFCQKELELNKRLCPDIYLEVVPITKAGNIKVGGSGEIIEYALKMVRLPQEKIMTLLLKEDKVGNETVDEIAEIVADFHSKAQTSNEINEFGSLKTVKTNWDENFAQTTKYINQTISQNENQYLYGEKQTAI
jgi:aminoglycoside phosphotransferase family enzyme